MTIRVVCARCAAKLDIREELAGATRRCPKCKTEFTVPAAEDEEGVSIAEQDEEAAVAEQAPAVAAAETAQRADAAASPPDAPLSGMTDGDDDDEDYVPSFVTAPASEKTPPKPTPTAKNDDDGPVLSIPKGPLPPRPKSKTFDPEEFLKDDDSPAPSPAAVREPPRRNPFEVDDEPRTPMRAKSTRSGARDRQRPSAGTGAPLESATPAVGGTRDRAQAARELRQALKESALKPAEEEEKARGIAFELSVLFSEIGIKGLAMFLGALVVAVGLYFVSYRVLVGKPRLPELGYVTGTVTLDGSPATGATVYFAPVEQSVDSGGKKIIPRTSFGLVNEKGEYRMMYQEGIPGVTVGKCRVWVALPPPKMALEFSQVAMETREVLPGKQTFDFRLTSPPRTR